MPLEIGEAINSMADKITSAPVLENIARNPIYTGLLVTFIIVLIIMFVFRDVDTDEGLLSLCLRSGFYIFIILTGVLFIHNKLLMKETSSISKDSEVASVFGQGETYSGIVNPNVPPSRHTTGIEDSIIPVQVNYNFDNSF